jgi:hypothetical protein
MGCKIQMQDRTRVAYIIKNFRTGDDVKQASVTSCPSAEAYILNDFDFRIRQM